MNDSKTSLYKTLSLFILVLSVISIYCVSWGPLRDWGASFRPARTMNVSASDFKYVTPDIATLSFSVVSEGKDVKVITEENNQKINKAIDYLKNEKGVSEEDVKTTQYNLRPVYSQSTSSYISSSFVPRIEMYSLTQTVEVKIRDFEIISSIIASLSDFGINKISNVSFGIEDQDKYLSDVQKSAFDKAHEKAERMAKQNGVKLGRVINVSVNNNTPYYAYGLGATKSYDAEGLGGIAPSIEPGSERLNISVFVEYEIK